MAAAPVKPHALHNFTVSLKWGQTTKLASGASHRHNRHGSGSRPAPPQLSDSDADSDRGETDAANLPPRATITPAAAATVHRVGSRSARQQRSCFSSCSTIFRKPKEASDEVMIMEAEAGDHSEEEAEEEEANQRPWKLRPRRGLSCAGGGQMIQQPREGGQQQQPKSVRVRGSAEAIGVGGDDVCGGGSGGGGCLEKRKFWIALSKEEIEEDVFILTGSRPARRPRKRPKNVQKFVDNTFPGLWLVGSTVDSYRMVI